MSCCGKQEAKEGKNNTLRMGFPRDESVKKDNKREKGRIFYVLTSV